MITGAGGYVGGRLVPMLRDDGAEVEALVREPAPRLAIHQTVCDLSDASESLLAPAFAGAEAVIHLAGENEVLAAQAPAAALAATVLATERVAEACAAARVPRLVYVSTVHAYGARIAPGVTLEEDMRPEPRSAYAISRLASEHIAVAAAGPECATVVLRLTNSVGAPDAPEVDRWTLVANDLSRQGAVDGRLKLRSSGVQWRDFVPLPDVCAALAAAARGRLPAGTYNFGSGEPITVRRLAEMVQDEFERRTGSRPELRAPAPEGSPPEPYRVSVSRCAQHGVGSTTPLDSAVAETVRFCLEHREELR